MVNVARPIAREEDNKKKWGHAKLDAGAEMEKGTRSLAKVTRVTPNRGMW